MIRILIFVVFTSFVFSCQNDTDSSKSKNSNVEKSASATNADGTKRILRAEKSEKPEKAVDYVKEAKIKEDLKQKSYEEERERIFEKNKKIRADAKDKKVDPDVDENGMKEVRDGLKVGEHYDFATYDFPSTCDLLSSNWLANTFEVTEGDIQIVDSSNPNTGYVKSCFFKWEAAHVSNGGIMLQIQGNPVPEETQAWVRGFIEAKRKEGESTMDMPGVRMTYKNLEGLGDEAVYNYSLNRCFWRLGEDYLFMLAFNLGLSEEEEKAAALKIGNEAIKNFKKINKK